MVKFFILFLHRNWTLLEPIVIGALRFVKLQPTFAANIHFSYIFIPTKFTFNNLWVKQAEPRLKQQKRAGKSIKVSLLLPQLLNCTLQNVIKLYFNIKHDVTNDRQLKQMDDRSARAHNLATQLSSADAPPRDVWIICNWKLKAIAIRFVSFIDFWILLKASAGVECGVNDPVALMQPEMDFE